MSALEEHDRIQLKIVRNSMKFLERNASQGSWNVSMEFPIPGKNDPIGYLDVLIETGSKAIAIEVKSHIDSIGETIRQINKYRSALPWCSCPYRYGQKHHVADGRHYSPEFVIASPDFRYIDVIESQDIRFMKVGVRDEYIETRRVAVQRIRDLEGMDFLTEEERLEYEGLRKEANYWGLAGVGLVDLPAAGRPSGSV